MKCFSASVLSFFLVAAWTLSDGVGCASRPVPPSAEGEAPRLDFGLGPDFQSDTIHGLDFDVFYFTSPTHKSSMLVYVGFRPSLHSSGQKAGALTRTTGQVGGVPVEWTRWREGQLLHSEALARGLYAGFERGADGEAPSVSRLIVHIFITAQDAGEVARLESAAAKMKLETRMGK